MIFDVIAVVLLLFGAWRGFGQGLAKQSVQLLALFGGLAAADPLGSLLAARAERVFGFLPVEIRASVLALGCLVVVWFLISTVLQLVVNAYRRRVYGELRPSFGDRLFGVPVGMLKTALLFALLTFGVRRMPDSFRGMAGLDGPLAASQAENVAQSFQPIERILKFPDIVTLGRHSAIVVGYFKVKEPPAPPPVEPADAAPPEAPAAGAAAPEGQGNTPGP